MKKLFAIFCTICALTLCNSIYSFASTDTPNNCSTVSGASVSGSFTSATRHNYRVSLKNNSGYRCSASFKVEAKTTAGTWEFIGSGILTAHNGGADFQDFNTDGYTNARVVDISTWRCN